MIEKKDMPQLMTLVINGTFPKHMAIPYLQYYIQKFGPLDESDSVTKQFMKIIKGE